MIKRILKWFRKEPEKEFLLWGVLEGPIRADEMPDAPFDSPAVMMVIKFSHGDKVGHGEFWFDSMEEAYSIVKHFHHTIEPIKMSGKDFELVK